MENKLWGEIASRIVDIQPIDIDPVIAGNGKPTASGAWLVRDEGHMQVSPAAASWQLKDSECIAVAVRVEKKLRNVDRIASRLAALAHERNIFPIIFSKIDKSGFEQFGFRVECLIGFDAAQMAICEDELKRFWGIALVLGTDEILAMR